MLGGGAIKHDPPQSLKGTNDDDGQKVHGEWKKWRKSKYVAK